MELGTAIYARRGRGHGPGAAPGCRLVRRRGARRPWTRRRAGAGVAVPAGAGEQRRTRLAAAQSLAAREPRRGNGKVDAALAAGAARRRAAGADRGRAGARQVASDRGNSYPAKRYAAHLGRMELLTTPTEQTAAPSRRMGPPTLWRGRCAGGASFRGPGKFAGPSQARSGGECRIARPALRHIGAAGTRDELWRPRSCGAGN